MGVPRFNTGYTRVSSNDAMQSELVQGVAGVKQYVEQVKNNKRLVYSQGLSDQLTTDNEFVIYKSFVEHEARLKKSGYINEKTQRGLYPFSQEPLTQACKMLSAAKLLTPENFDFMKGVVALVGHNDLLIRLVVKQLRAHPKLTTSQKQHFLSIFSILSGNELLSASWIKFVMNCSVSLAHSFNTILDALNECRSVTLDNLYFLNVIKNANALATDLLRLKPSSQAEASMILSGVEAGKGQTLMVEYVKNIKKQAYFFPTGLKKALETPGEDHSFRIYDAYFKARGALKFRGFLRGQGFKAFEDEPLTKACNTLQSIGQLEIFSFKLIENASKDVLNEIGGVVGTKEEIKNKVSAILSRLTDGRTLNTTDVSKSYKVEEPPEELNKYRRIIRGYYMSGPAYINHPDMLELSSDQRTEVLNHLQTITSSLEDEVRTMVSAKGGVDNILYCRSLVNAYFLGQHNFEASLKEGQLTDEEQRRVKTYLDESASNIEAKLLSIVTSVAPSTEDVQHKRLLDANLCDSPALTEFCMQELGDKPDMELGLLRQFKDASLLPPDVNDTDFVKMMLHHPKNIDILSALKQHELLTFAIYDKYLPLFNKFKALKPVGAIDLQTAIGRFKQLMDADLLNHDAISPPHLYDVIMDKQFDHKLYCLTSLPDQRYINQVLKYPAPAQLAEFIRRCKAVTLNHKVLLQMIVGHVIDASESKLNTINEVLSRLETSKVFKNRNKIENLEQAVIHFEKLKQVMSQPGWESKLAGRGIQTKFDQLLLKKSDEPQASPNALVNHRDHSSQTPLDDVRDHSSDLRQNVSEKERAVAPTSSSFSQSFFKLKTRMSSSIESLLFEESDPKSPNVSPKQSTPIASRAKVAPPSTPLEFGLHFFKELEIPLTDDNRKLLQKNAHVWFKKDLINDWNGITLLGDSLDKNELLAILALNNPTSPKLQLENFVNNSLAKQNQAKTTQANINTIFAVLRKNNIDTKCLDFSKYDPLQIEAYEATVSFLDKKKWLTSEIVSVIQDKDPIVINHCLQLVMLAKLSGTYMNTLKALSARDDIDYLYEISEALKSNKLATTPQYLNNWISQSIPITTIWRGVKLVEALKLPLTEEIMSLLNQNAAFWFSDELSEQWEPVIAGEVVFAPLKLLELLASRPKNPEEKVRLFINPNDLSASEDNRKWFLSHDESNRSCAQLLSSLNLLDKADWKTQVLKLTERKDFHDFYRASAMIRDAKVDGATELVKSWMDNGENMKAIVVGLRRYKTENTPMTRENVQALTSSSSRPSQGGLFSSPSQGRISDEANKPGATTPPTRRD